MVFKKCRDLLAGQALLCDQRDFAVSYRCDTLCAGGPDRMTVT